MGGGLFLPHGLRIIMQPWFSCSNHSGFCHMWFLVVASLLALMGGGLALLLLGAGLALKMAKG